ncbi:MAG: L,D-transpeptidase [Rhizobiaceae bacterium]|nr:L,D-transpeptidase [Rhizobiaceae bacterium]
MSASHILLSRRRFLGAASVAVAGAALSACASTPHMSYAPQPAEPQFPADPEFGSYAMMYGPVSDGGFDVPAVPYEKIDRQFLRQVVPDPTGERPGTVVVDTSSHHLYLVREGGQAIRYGVGLGRAGFEWAGRAEIRWKQRWPKWTPPAEMIARQPELAKYSAENGGMPPGLMNPLGARAHYIFQGDEDTLYRVHGSPEWWSIGKSVSSGCVRMMNQDVMDLYDRVPNQTPIIVTNNVGTPMASSPFDQGDPIDSGVPAGSVLLGRV